MIDISNRIANKKHYSRRARTSTPRRTNSISTSFYPYYDSLTTTLHPPVVQSTNNSTVSNEEYNWTDGSTGDDFFTTMPNNTSVIATTSATANLIIPDPYSSTGTSTLASDSHSFATARFRSTYYNGEVEMNPIMNDTTSTRCTKNKPPHVLERNENEVRNSILAGSLAGVTSCSLFHPFDVVRTKMQVSTKIFETTTSGRGAAAVATTILNPKTTSSVRSRITSSMGSLAVIAHTYKNGGYRAFYTGISLPLAAQAMYKSTILTTNRVASNALVDWKSKEQWKTGTFTQYQLTLGDRFLCGSLSGAVNALLFVCPVEFVRNQLIQQHTKKSQGKVFSELMKGPTDVIKNTLRTDGIFGLWRGAGVTLVRDSIGCGAFFIMNELGKKNISHLTSFEEGTLPNTLGSGVMAGFGYWFVSLPLDTLKTLVQTGRSPSAVDTVSYLVKRNGGVGAVTQLYRGWQLAFSRGSASAAITLTTYSFIYNFCSRVLT